MNLLDRLLPGTGARGRTYSVWLAMQERVADMDDQDRLIADLVRQRDDALAMASAAAAQVEEFRQRVNEAEANAERARRDAEDAQAEATRLRAELANATAVSVSMYTSDAPTEEFELPPVVSLMARGAA
ncbi:hypothetical protein [Streptacidiphilus sp. MAP5-3]|uniref:hypothetical protein n=1 Tax=unclassified Streptacidiphilus TaxID=2643834 RepID=UPI003518DB17